MAAFHALSAMSNPAPQPISIRGAAASRVLGNALRGAGISTSRPHGMDVDASRGPAVHPARPGRAAGPLDQTGRHRPPKHTDTPYQQHAPAPRRGRGGRPGVPGRHPAGTPPTLSTRPRPDQAARDQARSGLNKKLGGDEMKAWLKSRMIADGVLDMSNLQSDEWLTANGIVPPGHPAAPANTGLVFWRLIDQVFKKTDHITIHTLSLANNNLNHLKQLEKLPFWLPDIRALDLSANPIREIVELDNLLANGEKKGKANAGMGSLKSLVELKLNECPFREKTLAQPDGEAQYKHEILRRFPGLRILDGISLERVVFPIERKPRVKHTEEEKRALRSRPLSFPVDVKPEFFSEQAARDLAMAFCARYFPLFDTDRAGCLAAYAPNALVSISANTLSSRSVQSLTIDRTRTDRPRPSAFDRWISLPSRNFFRSATSIQERMHTLQTAADPGKLKEWWEARVPGTQHPLTDPAQWCFECWVLDTEGGDVRLCLMVQGMFKELPSGSFRSFSRTFILAEAHNGSLAMHAGFPASVLSDTMVVSSYLGSAAYDGTRPLDMIHGVSIVPPSIPFAPVPSASASASASVPSASTPAPAPAPAPAPEDPQRSILITQINQQTGMNRTFAELCLSQNGWDLEAAVRNFREIKGSIPVEAFQ